MRVFISWSGEPSKSVAQALAAWLPNVLQSVKPFLSEEIAKGSRWGAEIAQALDESEFGICCVTPFNQDSAWLLFEAGAIAKSLDAGRMTPLLVGVKKADLSQPLATFQATVADRDDMRRLVGDINTLLGKQQLAEERLQQTFEKWWGDIESVFEKVDKDIRAGAYGSANPERSPQDILEEMLDLVREVHRRQDAEEQARAMLGQSVAYAPSGAVPYWIYPWATPGTGNGTQMMKNALTAFIRGEEFNPSSDMPAESSEAHATDSGSVRGLVEPEDESEPSHGGSKE